MRFNIGAANYGTDLIAEQKEPVEKEKLKTPNSGNNFKSLKGERDPKQVGSFAFTRSGVLFFLS